MLIIFSGLPGAAGKTTIARALGGGLHAELEKILGVKVDLVTPMELPKRIRARVVAEAAPM